MLLDKLFDSVYDTASRFVTRGRIFCFLFGMFFCSDSFYGLVFDSFWMKHSGDVGEALIKAVTDAPLWLFLLILFSAFYLAPWVVRSVSLMFVRVELNNKEVLDLIEKVEIAIGQVPLEIASDELGLAKSKALVVEERIMAWKALLEIFFFFFLYGALVFLTGRANFLFFVFVAIGLFFSYRLLRDILNGYIQFIYYYKKLAVRIGSSMTLR